MAAVMGCHDPALLGRLPTGHLVPILGDDLILLYIVPAAEYTAMIVKGAVIVAHS